MSDQLFVNLTKEAKIDFFVKCQGLLLKYHPDSNFLVRARDLAAKLSYVQDFFAKYQGYYWSDDNICVLYNHVIVTDNTDPALAIRSNMWKSPHPEYNAASIDFVVFRDKMDCLTWVKSRYNPRIQYVIYVKNNQPKIYKTDQLVGRLFSLTS